MNNRQVLKVGVLHPGLMGESVAASIQQSGHTVFWVSEGRREQTRKRAEKHGLKDANSLPELCGRADVIISICPPHAAEDMADQILACCFNGIYVDANAISPDRALQIAVRMQQAGVDFVDGGIIGVPAWEPGKTWLHLSGQRSEQIAMLFEKGPMETNIVGTEPGQASSLKMCYAGYNKGNTALLTAILALAEVSGVRGHLEKQWDNHWPGFNEATGNKIRSASVKAWRFTGEMQEIASTLQQAGLPGGFHQAAEEIYQGMAHFKDVNPKPALEEILKSLKEEMQ